MKHIYFLLITSLITIHSAFSQKRDFEAGFVVKNSDTIPGFISRQDERTLSRGIIFKTRNGAESSYFPEDLNGFGFSTDQIGFERVQVVLHAGVDSVNEARFAKLIVKGPVSLYKLQVSDAELTTIYLTDNSFIFLVKKDGAFYNLGQYEKMVENNKYLLDKKYIGFARALFNDCPTLRSSDFDRLDFTEKAIASLVQQYNLCLNPNQKSEVVKYDVKPIVKHGAELAYSIILPYIQEEIPNSRGISVGYFWDVTKPDISRKSSLKTGVSYMYLTYDYSYLNWLEKKLTAQIKEHYLLLPILAQKNLGNLNQKTIPFLNLGVVAAFNADENVKHFDFTPFCSLGAGVYVKNLRLAVNGQTLGLSFKSDRLLTFGLGYRFDGFKKH